MESLLPNIALLLLPALVGILLLFRLFPEWSAELKLCLGALTGPVIGTSLAFVFALVVPVHTSGAILVSLNLAALLGLRRELKLCNFAIKDSYFLLGLCVVMLISAMLSANILVHEEGSLYTAHDNCYGDLPWHLANVLTFSAGQSFPPSNPIFAGNPLIYPFLSSFLSGMLHNAGSSLQWALALPSFFFTTLGLMLFYVLSRELSASKFVALISLLLLIFSGASFGFLELLEPGASKVKNYYSGFAGDADRYFLPNPLLAYFIPQRSFMLGMPAAMAILTILFRYGSDKKALLLAGALSGLLPLVHSHSVLALVPFVLAWAVRSRLKNLLYYVLPALIIGLPEVYYLLSAPNIQSSLNYKTGWMAGDENILLFWIRNTGLLIPLACLAFVLKAPRNLTWLFAPALVWLIVPNFVLFARWEWDNTKLICYFLILITPLAAWSLAAPFQKSSDSFGSLTLRGLAIFAIALQCFAAAIDLTRFMNPDKNLMRLFSKEAVSAAELIRKNVPVGRSVVSAPIHNSAVVLAGRPMYLGYPGQVWTHGGAYWAREAALKDFFEGKLGELPEIQPHYLLYGPVEQEKFPNFKRRPDWKLLFNKAGYKLFQIAE